MSIEELIYKVFTAAGLKTSSSADAVLTGRFSIYNFIDGDFNYLGGPDVKTTAEMAEISFNCYGPTKGEAYAELRAVNQLLENLKLYTTGVNSSVVYGIQALPSMNKMHAYTLSARIIYFETLT